MTGPILIVDDSLTVRMDLRDAFHEAELPSLECATAAAAREVVRATALGVVVLDIVLPDGDGISLLQEIRASPLNARVPVMLLSSEADVRDRVHGITHGADEYVGKPYDPAYVVGRAKELLSAGAAQPSDDARRVILCIDGSPTARAGLAEELISAGYRVVHAENGERGLRLAAEDRPDAVILNAALPGIDGYTVLRRLKLDATLRRAPVLMFSELEEPDGEVLALEAGADAFIRKGEQSGAIVARLASIFRGAERGAREPELAASSLGPKRIVLVDGCPARRDAIAAALRTEGYDLVLARSGREALELLRVQRADCVLLEFALADGPAGEICRELRGTPALRDVPVVVVHAPDASERLIDSMNAGADDYVTSASGTDVIRARVRAQLRRRQLEEENRSLQQRALHQEREAAESRAAQQLATMRAALLADLEHKNEKLREADRHKNEFLGLLSHELRNPLAPILNAIYILDHAEAGSDRAQRAKAVIARQVHHLKGLVDDLLDVTRISRGKVQLRRGRVELVELVRRAIEDHQSLFLDRQIEVSLDVDGRPHCINADATRITQAVGNLLQNAAKFTNTRGHVAVSVEGTGRSVVIRVADDGVGIEPEILPHVFEPFRQADTTLERSMGGLGLGLALVKGLVELHGGSAEAASEGRGRGAVFTLRLPRAADVPIPLETPKTPAPSPLPRRRVLVIEDNHDSAETLREVLEMIGQEVAVAHDGREGVAKARATRPEIVFCDIGLPELDGYEVARRIRADPDLAPVLVALTGYARPDDQQRAAAAGFDHHLAKPLELERLEALLANAKGVER